MTGWRLVAVTLGGLLTLAEGPRMVTNIVDCDFDKLKCEQAVKVVFKPSEGGPPLPMFTPV